ncbi:MAG: hypothetical protein WCF84_26290 [Anaerolineae bacterium]
MKTFLQRRIWTIAAILVWLAVLAIIPTVLPNSSQAAPLCNIDGNSVRQVDPAAADYVLSTEFKDVPVLDILAAKYGASPTHLAYDWRAFELNWGERYYSTHGVYPTPALFQNVGIWTDMVNEFAGCENMEAPLLEDGRLKRNFYPYWR